MSGIFDAVGGVLDTVLGGFIPDVPSAPALPAPQATGLENKVPSAPTDSQVEDVKKKSLVNQQSREGRRSTILTNTSGDLKKTVMGNSIGGTKPK